MTFVIFSNFTAFSAGQKTLMTKKVSVIYPTVDQPEKLIARIQKDVREQNDVVMGGWKLFYQRHILNLKRSTGLDFTESQAKAMLLSDEVYIDYIDGSKIGNTGWIPSVSNYGDCTTPTGKIPCLFYQEIPLLKLSSKQFSTPTEMQPCLNSVYLKKQLIIKEEEETEIEVPQDDQRQKQAQAQSQTTNNYFYGSPNEVQNSGLVVLDFIAAPTFIPPTVGINQVDPMNVFITNNTTNSNVYGDEDEPIVYNPEDGKKKCWDGSWPKLHTYADGATQWLCPSKGTGGLPSTTGTTGTGGLPATENESSGTGGLPGEGSGGLPGGN